MPESGREWERPINNKVETQSVIGKRSAAISGNSSNNFKNNSNKNKNNKIISSNLKNKPAIKMYSDQQLVLVNGGTLNSNDAIGDERQRNTATVHNNRSQQQRQHQHQQQQQKQQRQKIGSVAPVAELVQNVNYTNVNGQTQTQATIFLNHNNYRKIPPNLQNNVAAVAACAYNNCNNNTNNSNNNNNSFSNLSFYAQQPTSNYNNNNELFQVEQVCVTFSVSPFNLVLLSTNSTSSWILWAQRAFFSFFICCVLIAKHFAINENVNELHTLRAEHGELAACRRRRQHRCRLSRSNSFSSPFSPDRRLWLPTLFWLVLPAHAHIFTRTHKHSRS